MRVASTLVELGEPSTGAAWLEEYFDGEDLTPPLNRRWAWDEVADLGRGWLVVLQPVTRLALCPGISDRTTSDDWQTASTKVSEWVARLSGCCCWCRSDQCG